MIGLFYMGWVMVSHIGAKIREFNHYVNRHVDSQTNTYVDIYGTRRDNDTGQLRTRIIENNGDIVLLDKKHRVVKNVSQEERIQKWEQKRKDPARDTIMETALKTKEHRTAKHINPVTGEPMYVKGIVHLDYETGEEYYQVAITVDKKYSHCTVDILKYFYVRVNNPFDLVRISDLQKEGEKSCKESGLHNWIDDSKSEKDFIEDYNHRPYKASDIKIKTKRTRIDTI